MKFYYTNSATFLGPQPDPDKSLGGFVSSSGIPNNLINNIFGDISQYTIDKDLVEIKAIVLKNETGVDVTDLKLWFDYLTTAQVKIEVAVVSLAKNDCDEFYMESIVNMRATPYTGTFYDPNGILNAITIGNLAKNAYLGIWLRRSLVSSAVTPTCDVLYANFKANTVLPTKDDTTLQLTWN